jgi:hypothetical protein
MTRADVVAEARRWLGVKFRPKGRSRAGVDCIGLLVMVGRAFAVAHVDQQHYTDWPDPQREMLRQFDRFLERRPADQSWEGTVGVFAQTRLPCHTGIFSLQHGVPHVIHARANMRVVLEEPHNLDPTPRAMRLVALYGFPGLVDN